MLQFSFFSFAFENPFNLSHSQFILQHPFDCLIVKQFLKSSKLLLSSTSVFYLICTFDNDWASSVRFLILAQILCRIKDLSGNLSQKRENNEPIPFLLKNCCGIFSKKWNWRSLPFLFHCFPMALCCLIKHHWVLLFHEFEAAGNKTENDFITKIFSQAFLHLEMFYNTLFNFLSFCRIWTIQRVASVTYNIPFQSNDFLKLSKANFSSTTVVTMFSDFVILSTSWLVLIVHVWCQCIIFSEIELEDSKGKLLLEDKLHNIGCFCSSFNIFSKHLIRCFCRNETQDSPKRTFARNQLLQDLLYLFSSQHLFESIASSLIDVNQQFSQKWRLEFSKPNFCSKTMDTLFDVFVVFSTSFPTSLIKVVWCQSIIFSEMKLGALKSQILLIL